MAQSDSIIHRIKGLPVQILLMHSAGLWNPTSLRGSSDLQVELELVL